VQTDLAEAWNLEDAANKGAEGNLVNSGASSIKNSFKLLAEVDEQSLKLQISLQDFRDPELL